MADPERISVEEYRRLVAAATKDQKSTFRSKGAPRRRITDERGDSVLKRIMRLMAPRKVSARLQIKPEEQLAIAFANALRALTIEGRLRCVWTHPANELAGKRSGLSQIRYAIAKAMGLIDGTPDYFFLAGDRSGALEAKIKGNGQQPNQIDYQAWCAAVGVPYATFTSVEEGLAHLTQWGLLLTEPLPWPNDPTDE